MQQLNTGDRFKINDGSYKGKVFEVVTVFGEPTQYGCRNLSKADGISYGFPHKAIEHYSEVGSFEAVEAAANSSVVPIAA